MSITTIQNSEPDIVRGMDYPKDLIQYENLKTAHFKKKFLTILSENLETERVSLNFGSK